uniref:Succinate dehydrogenase assembly factor 2, mitochondrial n=1 Tax=Aureoumbra lagunensis TaxID=44058 RepID=A0A7S3K6Z6_9STRA|mmetsp:Transcript_1764/g.2340  ORF Transcript_1764/g.2340 Transcript_1764/m.2340 type:complete len:156 (-) Transcript_1764:116-583(-)
MISRHLRVSIPQAVRSVRPLSNIRDVAITPELEARANARWADIVRSHRSIPADDETRRKRLIYRSKQRGWLEVDLLLGTFATQYVSTFNEKECNEYEAILNCETIDIFNYITAKVPVPNEIDTPMMKRLQAFCKISPAGIDPDSYARVKTQANLT